jgi:hypothetical protein
MQKNLLICTALVVILSAAACKKNNTAQPPADTGDYQPLTTGSEWTYTVTGTNAGVFKISAVNKDSAISGRTYKVFANSAGANEYYYKSAGDYFRYNSIKELNNQLVEVLYLKDNLAKGQQWSELKTVTINVGAPLGTVPVTVQFTFTVADKGIDYTVDGVTFKNVIKITAVPAFSVLVGGVPNSIPSTSDLQYFYAKNIGLIYSKTILTIPAASINASSETKLGAYIIK